MRIEDAKIIESFNKAVDAGHPDPVGFLARSEIKTGFDYDGEFKGATGVFGVDKKQATKRGFTDDELGSTDGNFAAAITVDLDNYRKSNGDIDEMYRMGNPGNDKSTDRFISKLGKERKSFEERMVFEDGQLVGLSEPEKNEPVSEGKVITTKSSSLESPEDVHKETQKISFQQADKQQIDDLLVRLVSTIIDEKPINGV